MREYEIDRDWLGRLRVREVNGCGGCLGFILLCLVFLCLVPTFTPSDVTSNSDRGGGRTATAGPPPNGVRSTGVPGVVHEWVDIHSKPSLDHSTIIGGIPSYATVTVYCQSFGPSVTQSNGDENPHWDLIRYTYHGNTTDGYIPDALVSTNNIFTSTQIDSC